MLKITTEATDHLLPIRTESGFDEGVGARFARGTNGVGLTFADAPEPGDQVLTGFDLPVFIAEDVNARLERSLIDVSSVEDASRLVLRSQTRDTS
jgi:hypothetical protein